MGRTKLFEEVFYFRMWRGAKARIDQLAKEDRCFAADICRRAMDDYLNKRESVNGHKPRKKKGAGG